MSTPSPARINPLRAFAGAFTGPTFAHALTLVYGALPAPDRRTVASALRSVGLDDEGMSRPTTTSSIKQDPTPFVIIGQA